MVKLFRVRYEVLTAPTQGSVCRSSFVQMTLEQSEKKVKVYRSACLAT